MPRAHPRRHRLSLPLLLLTPAALLLAACGGDSTGSSAAAATSPAGAGTQTGNSTITTVTAAAGTVLAGPNGHTLYVLVDSSGTALTCSGGCLSAWPPVLQPTVPTAGNGVTAAIASTHTAAGTQVTVDGRPVYNFAGDSSRGQVNGQGIHSFGGTWYALGADGRPLAAGASSSSGGGYAYP